MNLRLLHAAPAAILALTLGIGCGPDQGHDDDDAPGAQLNDLSGIWNVDFHRQTLDGEPFDQVYAGTFRFDANGDGWSCIRGTLRAERCTFEAPDPESFEYVDSYARNYGSYVVTVTNTIRGESYSSDDVLSTSFVSNYLYTYADGSSAERVITGEAKLYRLRPFEAEASHGLRLLGEFGAFSDSNALFKHTSHEEDETGGKAASGSATANVRVKDGFAYVARFGDGLYVLDVSDPASIVEVAHAPVEDVGAYYYNDVKLLSAGGRDYAVCSDAGIGLVIYDVTDPADPVFVSSFFEGLKTEDGTLVDALNNHTAFVVGTTAYLGNYEGSWTLDPSGDGSSGGLLIVDLSDPAHPRELGRWLAREVGGTFVHDLMVEGDIAWLSSWEAGLVALDVSDPANPTVMGQFVYERMTAHSVWAAEVGGRRVAAHGDEDFGSHLRIVDADPDSPTFMSEIGALQLRPQVSIHNVMIDGDEVIAAHYQDGLRIFDISDPTQPRLTRWYNSWIGYPDDRYGYSFYEGAIGVDVVGSTIYLADIERGLLIFERE